MISDVYNNIRCVFALHFIETKKLRSTRRHRRQHSICDMIQKHALGSAVYILGSFKVQVPACRSAAVHSSYTGFLTFSAYGHRVRPNESYRAIRTFFREHGRGTKGGKGGKSCAAPYTPTAPHAHTISQQHRTKLRRGLPEQFPRS